MKRPFSFLFNPAPHWTEKMVDGVKCFYAGRQKTVNQLVSLLNKDQQPDIDLIGDRAKTLPGHFALVAVTKAWLIAITDKIRSYHLFYSFKEDRLFVSNCCRKLKETCNINTVDSGSVTELKMAAYVTGSHTIFRNLSQMQAAEILYEGESVEKSCIKRYYEFYDPLTIDDNEDALIDKLDEITDQIISRNINDADGNRIWVPLSGGLDSRLVLCKLKQHRYDNLKTYSYGTKGNYDALRAQEIADKLNIAWEFFPTDKATAHSFFHSDRRRKFWAFADGLHVVPNLHGMFALESLDRKRKIKPGDVIINGQSGDFISGQHIPDLPQDTGLMAFLFQSLIQKHYNMRDRLLKDENAVKTIENRIKSVLGERIDPSDEQEFAKAYELWEWQERQVKRVVNGQMNYDWFGLSWELPLWETEYLHFWQSIPLSHKKGRRLFVNYLQKKNFFDVFRNFKPFMSRWPRGRTVIQHTGRGLKVLFGEKVSKYWYKKLDRFSQYGYLYDCIPTDRIRKNYLNYKGPLAYFTDIWLDENMRGDQI